MEIVGYEVDEAGSSLALDNGVVHSVEELSEEVIKELSDGKEKGED